MSKLKIAIQKSGRLNETSLQLLKSCGIKIDNGRDQLKVPATNFPMEVFFLRNSDIPQYLEDGIVDIAIVGENLLIEQQKDIVTIETLGFSKCRVSLAIPKDAVARDIRYFEGKKIATSYPNTVQQYLNTHNINAEIHKISGSVEIAPNIGLADGICDIVSTGSTLFKNGLKEIEVLFQSQAVLAACPQRSAEKQQLLDQFLFRIKTVLRAKNTRYVLMNVPNNKIEEVSNILPVLKSPTIMPLAEEGWSSLHSVIDEDRFWEVIDSLKSAGAEGILILPIEKIVA